MCCDFDPGAICNFVAKSFNHSSIPQGMQLNVFPKLYHLPCPPPSFPSSFLSLLLPFPPAPDDDDEEDLEPPPSYRNSMGSRRRSVFCESYEPGEDDAAVERVGRYHSNDNLLSLAGTHP